MILELFKNWCRSHMSADSFVRGCRRRAAAAQQIDLTSMVAHWRLDEASGTRVDVHGGNDLSPNNSPGSTTGKLGDALLLVGANEEDCGIADNAALSMGDIDFTVAGWVNLVSLGAGGVVAKWSSGSLEYEVFFDGTNFKFLVSTNGTATVSIVNSAAISTGTWYLLIAWHDSVGNTINLSVNNGGTASVGHSGGVFSGSSSLFLGREDSSLSWLDGAIDSVSIWKRVLTAGERTALYNGGAGLDYPF